MIFRFGSVLFRDEGAAGPRNGSNFAMCNRDKIHAPAHTLYYTPDEDRHQGRNIQAFQPVTIRWPFFLSYDVFNGTQQGVFSGP